MANAIGMTVLTIIALAIIACFWGLICSLLDISYTQVKGKAWSLITPAAQRSKVTIAIEPYSSRYYDYGRKFKWSVNVTMPDGRTLSDTGTSANERIAKNKAKHAAYKAIEEANQREKPPVVREYKF